MLDTNVFAQGSLRAVATIMLNTQPDGAVASCSSEGALSLCSKTSPPGAASLVERAHAALPSLRLANPSACVETGS